MVNYAFIGGAKRGYALIEKLLDMELIPAFGIIMKEDEHEAEKYSDKISDLLNKYGVPNSIKKKLSDADNELIKNSNLDFIIVYGWRTLIDPSLNKFSKLGFIAAHHSLLPKYRGFAPIQWAIINGESETGVTLFQISEGDIDSGMIIAQEKIPINPEDHGSNVEEHATNTAIELFLKLFKDQRSNDVSFTGQIDSDATYTCKRIPEDGKINWEQTSDQIYNLIRALSYPNTGAFCFYDNARYQILKARLGDSNEKNFAGIIPGRVYKIHFDGIEVMCGSGTVHIEIWESNSANVPAGSPSLIVKSLGSTLT